MSTTDQARTHTRIFSPQIQVHPALSPQIRLHRHQQRASSNQPTRRRHHILAMQDVSSRRASLSKASRCTGGRSTRTPLILHSLCNLPHLLPDGPVSTFNTPTTLSHDTASCRSSVRHGRHPFPSTISDLGTDYPCPRSAVDHTNELAVAVVARIRRCGPSSSVVRKG